MLDNVIEFLKNQNELTTAKQLLDTFSKYASRAAEYDLLAKWYMEIKQYPIAIQFAERAMVNISTNEGMYACRSNLAKLYNHANDPKSSLRYSSANLNINPDDKDALLEQVFSYFLLNEKPKSEQILRNLLTQDLSDNVLNRVKFNLGTYDLYHGKFQQGLRGFILEGKKLGIWKNPKLPFKFWEGGIQPDKTIIIYAEGGIGDEIINVRFYQTLVDYGMNPVWYTTRSDLLTVFNRLGINTTSNISSYPVDTLWTFSMSLPIYLDVTPEQLWFGPYLSADPEYIKKWTWIGQSDKKKIGLRWTGNPEYEHDLHRSVPLPILYPPFNKVEYKLYSLQRDTGADDAMYFPEITDLQDSLKTIEDTLAVIHHLDLVVTSCTSVAHMAAAMGKRTIILVPITAYYTWASTTDTSSIWYGDNVTILRQTVHKDWTGPLQQLSDLI